MDSLSSNRLLLIGVREGNLQKVKKAIKAGAQINSRPDRRSHFLHVAAGFGYVPIVRFLLRSRALVNCRERTEELTPLHCACRSSEPGVVHALLRARANVDLTCKSNGTALHEAARAGDLECVIRLMMANALVDACDMRKCTPLHIAAEFGHMEVVRTLISYEGWVTVAVMTFLPRDIAVVITRFSVQRRADANLMDDMGYTAIDRAWQRGWENIVDFLSDYLPKAARKRWREWL